MSDYGFHFKTDNGKWFQLDNISPYTLLDVYSANGNVKTFSKTYTQLIGKDCDVYCLDNVGVTDNRATGSASYSYNKSTGVFSYSFSSNKSVAWLQVSVYVRFY